MSSHSKYSASSSHRWLRCPASIQAENIVDDDNQSPYAIEGTRAHELAHLFGVNNYTTLQDVLTKFETTDEHKDMLIGFTDSDIEAMLFYSNYTISLSKRVTEDNGGRCTSLYEHRVNYPSIHPDGYGTVDYLLVDNANKEVHIVDFKFGMNKVSAYNNSQLLLYALGAYDSVLTHTPDRDDYEYHMVIIQPRADHVDKHIVDGDALRLFAKNIRNHIIPEINRENPKRVAGKVQCEYCSARSTCNEFLNHSNEIIKPFFDKAPVLSNDQLSKIICNKKLILAFITEAENIAVLRMQGGETIEGLKLGKSQTKTVWGKNADEYLYNRFGDVVYKQSLKPISQLKEKLSKQELESITTKAIPKTVCLPNDEVMGLIGKKTKKTKGLK